MSNAKKLPMADSSRSQHRREMPARKSETFVFAVVPFDQIAIDLGRGPEASQFAGASGSLRGTREDFCEGQFGRLYLDPAGVAPAALGQQHSSYARRLPRRAPADLTAPRQIGHWKILTHLAICANPPNCVLTQANFKGY
jgi:hypothetical protein